MSIAKLSPAPPRRFKNTRLYQTTAAVSTPAALGRLAATLMRRSGSRLWLLSGPLGSGKTTWVRGALRSLGVRGVIASPTFTLVKEYRPRTRGGRILHVDAYRIQRAQEIPALGLREALKDQQTLVLVEWPERLPGMRWPAGQLVRLSILPSGGRRLRLTRWAGGQLRIVPGSRRLQSSRSL